MILLDTNAVIWILADSPRPSSLLRQSSALYLSPVSLLEIKFLIEVGRIRATSEQSLAQITSDSRWILDDPPTRLLFETALDISWTRDPFDRLLVAHARCRQWQLATGDRHLQAELPLSSIIKL